jgi:hypothetical protein
MSAKAEELALCLKIKLVYDPETSAAKRDHWGSLVVGFRNVGLEVLFNIESVFGHSSFDLSFRLDQLSLYRYIFQVLRTLSYTESLRRFGKCELSRKPRSACDLPLRSWSRSRIHCCLLHRSCVLPSLSVFDLLCQWCRLEVSLRCERSQYRLIEPWPDCNTSCPKKRLLLFVESCCR